MMKEELIERLKARKVPLLMDSIGDEDYAILEEWYIMFDFDKDKFADIIKAFGGIEPLIIKKDYPRKVIKALDEYRERETYKQNKIKAEQMSRELARLKESIQAFEKNQIF